MNAYFWGYLGLAVGIFAVMMTVFFFSLSGTDQWATNCAAKDGEVVDLAGYEYCLIDGNVYPRQ